MQELLEGKFDLEKTFEIALVSLTFVRLTSVQENRGRGLDVVRTVPHSLGSIFESEIL